MLLSLNSWIWSTKKAVAIVRKKLLSQMTNEWVYSNQPKYAAGVVIVFFWHESQDSNVSLILQSLVFHICCMEDSLEQPFWRTILSLREAFI